MNKVQQRRNFFRSEIRKSEIEKKKSQIRNIILCLHHSNKAECFICANLWIIEEEKEKIIPLFIGIFHGNMLCFGHIQMVFSKILQILFEYPSFVSEFFAQNDEETANIFMRKVTLLYELLDNELLLQNKNIQDEITKIFQSKAQITKSLFNCAYDYESIFVYEGLKHEIVSQKLNITSLSNRIVLFIWNRYPLLLQMLCQDYPLVQLLRATGNEKIEELYSIFQRIASEYASQKDLFSPMMNSVEEALIYQLSQSRYFKDYEDKYLFELIQRILSLKASLSIEFQRKIIVACLKKYPSIHVQPVIEILLYKFNEEKTEQQKQYLREDVEMILDKLRSLEKMEIQIC